MLPKQPEMKAWTYEVDDNKNEIRIQIDKKHKEYSFLKEKAKEVGSIHESNGNLIASLFQMDIISFNRFYPKFELLKERIPREPKKKKEKIVEHDITDELLKFVSKKAHSKSDIVKKFKNSSKNTIDNLLKRLVKNEKLIIIGIKKASKYMAKK